MLNALAALALISASFGAPPTTADNGEGRMLIRHVAVGNNEIVFSYAGDLWKVGLGGGPAEQLTSGPADDDFPVISPDGLFLAFSRKDADDWDVYLLPTQGGELRRLTWNPAADIARGFTADSRRVLFMSERVADDYYILLTIGIDEPYPQMLRVPRGWTGSFEPNGQRIAYVPYSLPHELGDAEWRHYRGGRMSRIFVARLDNSVVELIPPADANDRDPMWVGGTIYFVSDRDGTFNLYAYDALLRSVQQLTQYQTYGIDDAAAGANIVAFVQDGQLRVFDTATGEVRTLPVQLEPDRSELEPRVVNGADFIESASPSASGDRVAFGVRGDVVMLDVAEGTMNNLTSSSGAADRYPAISPNGQWVAYFSDETGNYQLIVRSLVDSTDVRPIQVELQSSFYRELAWSPDSKRLAFSDKRLRLWVVDVETRGARRVTTSSYSYQDRYYPSWSPDGRWLAYSRYEENRLRAVYLYSAERGRQRRITHARVSAEHPTFDANGNYLYFVASSTASLGDFGWDVLSGMLLRPYSARRLHVVPLRGSISPPVYPISGEPIEGAAAARPPRAGQETITLQAIENRVIPLPLGPRDYADLATGQPDGLYVLVTEWPPSPTFGTEPTRTLYRYDLANPSELRKIVEGVDDFSVTADGDRILYRHGQKWSLVDGTGTGEFEPVEVDTEALQLEVDPAAEWRQIYHEAWRLMEDYFYDPNHHGQDLVGEEAHYADYLPSVVRRQDLNTLLRKALGHISVSHLRISGGDVPVPNGEPSNIGMLGADYFVDGEFYRIANVDRSAHYNAESRLAQAPLDQPGVNVRPGAFLLDVDGEPVRANRNLYSYFVGKAFQPTRITIGSDSAGSMTRSYIVIPLPEENTLRRWNWAQGNRQIVEQESQGVLGYIYVPDYTPSGIVAMFRQLLENTDRRGLVIDQRFAGGSITADYIIEMLNRRPLFFYTFRHGDDLPVPTNPVPEAKVLLINDANHSAAEAFALMFKLGNLGRVIGTRTWGAGVGPYVFVPPLMDGGTISVPSRAAYDPAGSWGIENMGVEPDLEVEWLPAEWIEGRDTQLLTAIRTVLQAIVDRPPLEVSRPEYPVHGQQQEGEGQ